MTTALPKHLEAFATPQGFEGQLADLPLPEILQHLRQSASTGVLTLVAGGAKKSIYLKDGRLVFAASNLPNDRLGEILLREGKITVDEYESSVKAISHGKRQGKVLVEMGALSPKDLWEGVQFQVKEIVYSLFTWEDGQFAFEESSLPEKERITVELDMKPLILTGLRRVDASGPIQARYPERAIIMEYVPEESSEGIEAYEEHVRELVDGERSVLDICRESEIGDSETLKVIYALLSVGMLRAKGRKVHTFDQDFVQEDTLFSVVESFNQMYGQVYRYMVKEVGPIAENVLEKYLNGLRESRADVFAGVSFKQEGELDAALVERNLDRFSEDDRRGRLIDALNELLYAELLAVKKTLGPEHEAAIIKLLRER